MIVDEVRANGYCYELRQTDPFRFIPLGLGLSYPRVHFLKDPRMGDKLRNSIMARDEKRLFGGMEFEIFHGVFEHAMA